MSGSVETAISPRSGDVGIAYASRMNIVFDFGNVLLDWTPTQLIAEHFPSIAPLPCTPEEFADRLANHQDWRDYDQGLIDTATVVGRRAPVVGVAETHLRTFVDRLPQVLKPLQPTIDLMHELADGRHGEHRVLYLSNMPTMFSDVLERRFDWLARFEGGIFSGRAQLSKPDDAIYAALEQQYGLDPAQTLFLDDVQRNVDAGRARGWRAELIDPANSPATVRAALVKHGVVAA